MHKKILNALELLNMLFQAIYLLFFPVGIGALISFLLTKYANAPSFVWAILITLGVLLGLYSMIKYIISTTENMKKLERQREMAEKEKQEKESRQARLRDAGKDIE